VTYARRTLAGLIRGRGFDSRRLHYKKAPRTVRFWGLLAYNILALQVEAAGGGGTRAEGVGPREDASEASGLVTRGSTRGGDDGQGASKPSCSA